MMGAAELNTFPGFTQRSLELLSEVHGRNSREWFERHRGEVEDELYHPFRALVAALAGPMLRIDPAFQVRPQVNKTISRIHRDTRFARDKSLYRDRLWLTFKRPGKNWQDTPGYFFELAPHSYRYGTGFYAASRQTLDTVRAGIDADPRAFLSTVSFMAQPDAPSIEGDRYKRDLPNPHPPELQTWYQRRNLCLIWNREIDATVLSASLADVLERQFQRVAPLYSYLWHHHPSAG